MMPRLSHIRFKSEGARADMVFKPSGEVIVESLYSEDKGKGHARRVLELMTEYADREAITLRLEAHRYGTEVSPNDEQLVAIYSKHGFVIDESYKEFVPPRMIRKPQRKKGNE